MQGEGSYEFSGFMVAGIGKALERLGYAPAVLPALDADTRARLRQGGLFKLHPGHVVHETLVAVAAVHGDDAVASLMEEVTRSTVAGIVGPLARMYLTFQGNDPHALFSRFEDLVRAPMRGVTARWDAEGPTAGAMTFGYPRPVPPVLAHGWRGSLRHVLHFAGVRGETWALEPTGDGRAVRVGVRWER